MTNGANHLGELTIQTLRDWIIVRWVGCGNVLKLSATKSNRASLAVDFHFKKVRQTQRKRSGCAVISWVTDSHSFYYTAFLGVLQVLTWRLMISIARLPRRFHESGADLVPTMRRCHMDSVLLYWKVSRIYTIARWSFMQPLVQPNDHSVDYGEWKYIYGAPWGKINSIIFVLATLDVPLQIACNNCERMNNTSRRISTETPSGLESHVMNDRSQLTAITQAAVENKCAKRYCLATLFIYWELVKIIFETVVKYANTRPITLILLTWSWSMQWICVYVIIIVLFFQSSTNDFLRSRLDLNWFIYLN